MALRSCDDAECPPSPKTAEQIEYIRQLEHRNRLKKSSAPKSVTRLREMEQGFALHFAGANNKKKRQSDPGKNPTVPARHVGGGRRRTWGGKKTTLQCEEENSLLDKLVAAAEPLDESSKRLLVDIAESGPDAIAELAQLVRLKKKRKILTIRIHDGWDVPRVAGLDALEFVGLEGAVEPSDLRLFAGNPSRPAPATSRSATELPRLLDSTQSWIVRLPSDGPVEVQVSMPLSFRPDGSTLCRISNCSATSGDRSVGTKQLEVALDGQRVWSGELARFCGKTEVRSDVLDIPLLAVEHTDEEATTTVLAPPAPAPEEVSNGPTKDIESLVRNLFPAASGTEEVLRLERDEQSVVDTTQSELVSDGVADEKPHVDENVAPRETALPVWLSHGKNVARRPLAAPVPPAASKSSSTTGRSRTDDVGAESNAGASEGVNGNAGHTSSERMLKSATRRRRPRMEAPAPAVDIQIDRAENLLPEGKQQWTQVEALKCEDALSPLSQLALLSEVQHQQRKAASPSQGRKKNESLQESWDSLTYFSKKSKSRLAQAGASILGFSSSNSPGENIADGDPSPLYETASFASQFLAESLLLDETSAAPQPAPEDGVVLIPTLPRGRILRLEILSTWGDPFYVGLHGIEVFDENGVEIKPISIAATPPSINVLPEYDSDPRTAEKLVDGVYCTCDELHAWLAPYESGAQEHSITLELVDVSEPTPPALSMLRIWNYNKSRAHSYRGARRVRASLDGTPIFDGEIRKAPGMLENAASASEMILFTVSEDLISKIERNDKAPGGEDKIDGALLRQAAHQLTQARPRTSEEVVLHRVALDSSTLSYSDMLAEEGLQRQDGRPPTSTATRQEPTVLKKMEPLFHVDEEPGEKIELSTSKELFLLTADVSEEMSRDDQRSSSTTTTTTIRARRITFRILSTWGDRHYVGLSGFTVFADATGTAIDVAPSQLSADPRDLVSLGHVGDPRTVDKLVDGVTQTSDDRHFWLVPFSEQKLPWVSFDLGSKKPVWGIGLYNYNKSPDDTSRGARLVQVEIDGVCKGVVELRQAPGVGGVNYQQRISFAEISEKEASSPPSSVCHVVASRFDDTSIILDDYETPELPCGSLLRLVLHGTFGDPYYVGLDGLELRDADNKPVEPERVCGFPESVRILGDDFKLDSRVPGNLFKRTSSSSWLAPTRISMPHSEFPGYSNENEVYLCLSKPVSISTMTLWNYSKTPTRGVKEVSLWIDSNLVARVRLKRADDASGAPQRILFGPDRFKHARSRLKRQQQGQDVLCIDENQVRIRSKAMFDTDVCAEGVFSSQLNHLDRPATAAAA